MRAAKVEERKKTKAKSVGQEGLLGERQSALPEWNTMELEMSGTRCLNTLISINFTKKLLSKKVNKKDIISLAKLKTKIRRKFANHESKLGFYNRTNLPLSHYFYFLYTAYVPCIISFSIIPNLLKEYVLCRMPIFIISILFMIFLHEVCTTIYYPDDKNCPSAKYNLNATSIPLHLL